ncbi:MAG: response regulator [Thermoproteota archaeon]|nr:response regulator [Thermoproteota archaeon]
MKRSLGDPPDNLEVNNSLLTSDLAEEISFLDRSLNCCVCFVDMINSSSITAGISNNQKIGQYYSIFINTMAILAKNYGAKIVKNAGDALIFYFAETLDPTNEAVFNEMFECFITMTSARNVINAKLHSENLPSVSYRISADYGRVEVASSTSSKGEDLFGSVMNTCAKINSMAEPNGIVIGGDLYQIVKSFSFTGKYHFIELKGRYCIGFNPGYPVYAALGNNAFEIDINNINQIFNSRQTSKIKDTRAEQQSQLLREHSQQKQQQEYFPNILLVDDEPDILFTYKHILSAEGYNVDAFKDPQQALKHLVKLPNPSSHYQLVLLDVRMPGLNGLQLFYRIRAISPNIKIMFCSALDIAEELVSILPGITYSDIIKKPLKSEYFLSKISSVLNNNGTAHFGSLGA